jgi:uncharacterized protein YdhG (YjbR/CyaY superfamily)
MAKETNKPADAKAPTTKAKAPKGFSAEERDAMKERAKEMKAAGTAAEGEKEVLAKIAEMPEPDRSLATRIHALVKKHAPELTSKTWYGMPAYAKNGKTICFFQNASKFKYRYATLGFSDDANLDDGNMWPAAFAIMKLTAADETRIGALIKQAAS